MRVHGFVLGVVLLALVGWCLVQESIKQTRARYELAELTRREDETRKNLEKLKAREESLRSPARLAALVKEKKLNLVVLGSAKPAAPDKPTGRMAAANRKPGEVLDEDFARVERPVRVATTGNW